MDAQPRVYHGLGVAGWTHLARAYGVVDGHGQVSDSALPIGVRAEKVLSTSGQRDPVKSRVELSKGRPLAYLEVQNYMRIEDKLGFSAMINSTNITTSLSEDISDERYILPLFGIELLLRVLV